MKKFRMRDFDMPTFVPDHERVSPLFQEEVYLIMWRSERSGGTYSIIRKSREGMLRYVYALEMIGWPKDQIKVIPQHKPWVPLKGEKRDTTELLPPENTIGGSEK